MEEQVREYYRIYFGKSANYYLELLENYFEGRKFSFNAAAFFIGLFWMLYRKMYRVFFIFLGGIIAEGFILEYIIFEEILQFSKGQLDAVSRIATIAFSAICSTTGNYFYLKQSIENVNRIVKNNEGNSDVIKEELARVGGVSWMGVLVFLLVVIFFVIIYIFSDNTSV